jgi:riboflavin synthase
MFTGLVEMMGEVLEITAGQGSKRFEIAASILSTEFERGESVAVDGVCLTVVSSVAGRFSADVVRETLSCTTLGLIEQGQQVNLERSLKVGDRIGGHWVQGHVDATARVDGVTHQGDDWRLRLKWTEDIRRFVAFKGSVTLQGVSLTVAGLDDAGFEVALIPETLKRTTLGKLASGDPVNVEVDLLARYLDRLITTGQEPPAGG